MNLQISVIIPVYNDTAGLRRTVSSLISQDFPASRYEIIIVDNGSTDGTWKMARALKATHPHLIAAVREDRVQSSYAARNRGIACASGEVLCFVDADMMGPATYLSRINARFSTEDVQYLGHAVQVVADRNSLSARYNRAQGFPIRAYLLEQHFAGAGCLSVRRTLLEKVGWFDGRLESSGDLEFGQRVYAAGFRQDFAGDIILQHPARANYRSLLAKARRLGRGDAQLKHHLPERYESRTERYRRPSYYLPRRPRGIVDQFASVGDNINLLSGLLLSIWALPLKWARPLACLKELRRLRAQTSEESEA